MGDNMQSHLSSQSTRRVLIFGMVLYIFGLFSHSFFLARADWNDALSRCQDNNRINWMLEEDAGISTHERVPCSFHDYSHGTIPGEVERHFQLFASDYTLNHFIDEIVWGGGSGNTIQFPLVLLYLILPITLVWFFINRGKDIDVYMETHSKVSFRLRILSFFLLFLSVFNVFFVTGNYFFVPKFYALFMIACIDLSFIWMQALFVILAIFALLFERAENRTHLIKKQFLRNFVIVFICIAFSMFMVSAFDKSGIMENLLNKEVAGFVGELDRDLEKSYEEHEEQLREIQSEAYINEISSQVRTILDQYLATHSAGIPQYHGMQEMSYSKYYQDAGGDSSVSGTLDSYSLPIDMCTNAEVTNKFKNPNYFVSEYSYGDGYMLYTIVLGEEGKILCAWKCDQETRKCSNF